MVLKAYIVRRKGHKGFIVSILVLLDMVLKGRSAKGNNSRRCVSILVLLDMVLKGTRQAAGRTFDESFNPCFAGYGSKSCLYKR